MKQGRAQLSLFCFRKERNMATKKTYPCYLDYHTKSAWFEVTQYFEAKMLKLSFGTYDKAKKVEIFLTIQEARQIEADIRAGLIQQRMKTAAANDKVYATQPKGKGGRYRYFSIIKGSSAKAPYVLVGQSGPGEETETGLVKIAGAPDTVISIPVPQVYCNVTNAEGKNELKPGGLKALADALSDAADAANQYSLMKWMQEREVADNG